MLLGINSLNHDASLALIDGDEIVWAAHSERYNRKKNSARLNLSILLDMQKYGYPTEIIWFEHPLLKDTRRLYSGERPWHVDPMDELRAIGLEQLPITYSTHHYSHAAAGYFTSGFTDAAILVVDAIGEWDTVSSWSAKGNEITANWKVRYPNSIGLFYTAMTQWLGLKPNEEEYILMGMAAYGEAKHVDELRDTFFKSWKPPYFKTRHNLHRGCLWWHPKDPLSSNFDIAASVQALTEEYLLATITEIRKQSNSDNLVFMGGVALNCVANTRIKHRGLFKNLWIMPNPGDSGNAIGAVAGITKRHLKWRGPYLGTNIDRELDIETIVKRLLDGHVVGVANGRAEFGPRALGNRSLLLDPRGSDAKDRMNAIKKREQFRPFAPAILAEHADTYFNMPVHESPYMQFVAECKRPDLFPGICHIDNTSRVQTVTKENNPQFRLLLEQWYKESGCPMLMNTSLNIKGEPLVNTWHGAMRFQTLNNVQVF